MSKKIYHALVPTKTNILKCEVIFWNKQFWLVPEWLENKNLKKMHPKRIILLDDLKHQTMMDNNDHQFVVNEPIPEDVLKGMMKSQTKYRVIHLPKIEYDTPELLH